MCLRDHLNLSTGYQQGGHDHGDPIREWGVEKGTIDRVHRRSIISIGEINQHLNNVGHRSACRNYDLPQIFECVLCLTGDVARVLRSIRLGGNQRCVQAAIGFNYPLQGRFRRRYTCVYWFSHGASPSFIMETVRGK